MNGNKAVKSGIWFTISNFIMKSVGLITTPIFTRLMSQKEFGDFNNFQTWLMILLYITSLDLEASLIRAVYDFKDDIDRYVHSLIVLSMVSTGVFWLISVLFRPYFVSFLSMDSIYIDCMFMYLLFCPAVNIFQNAERFKYKYKWTVASSLTISIGASLLSVVLVLFLANKLQGRVIGYISPTVIVGLLIAFYYFIKARPIRIQYWKYALPITLPYIPHLLSMYLLSNVDRIMIKRICGSEYAALYSLAYTCGMIITIMVTSINSAYSPWLAERLSKKEYESIKKICVPYVMVFSFLAFGAVLITPELLYILGGKPYLEAKYVMPPVAAGCLLQFAYCMYVNIEQYEKKTIGMAMASATAAGLNFVLNYIFIPKYGYIAAAYTTYIGYFILLAIHIWYVRKIGMSFVYKNKEILITASLASAFLFMTNYLFDKTRLRYFVILIYIVVSIALIIRNRDVIRKLIHK